MDRLPDLELVLRRSSKGMPVVRDMAGPRHDLGFKDARQPREIIGKLL